ncbi:dTMP kinase [Candidatus Berkelbacteria bacterium]|nr:dTMP kinase [Candidatus Berkelbacteria bacterium]
MDGSGSDIHAAALARLLSRDGYRVVLRHEPTNSMIGGLIRARLAGEWEIAPETLQLLFTADRAEHLRSMILPGLEAGKIVICDRYVLSALAYNVVLVNDREWLRALNKRFLKPDVTFLIQVDPKICARRLKEMHLELELHREESKLKHVWREYQALAAEFDGVHVIDGERDDVAIIDEIAERAKEALNERA